MKTPSASSAVPRSPTRLEKKPLSPTAIQYLPLELLELIFIAALPPGNSQEHYQQVDTLSLVCRRWNTVVKSTPSIWSTLNMRFPPYRNLVALERSINHPLEIHGMPLNNEDESDESDDGNENDENEGVYRNRSQKLRLLMKQSLPHVGRWSKVHWELPSVDAFYKLCDSTATAPLLEEATFMVHDLEDPPSPKLDFFGGHAPRLRTFTTNLPVPWDSEIFRNLTKLNLMDQATEDLTVAIFIRLLGRCPNLVDLELTGEGVFSHNYPQEECPIAPPIPLPNLRRLVLHSRICCLCSILESIQITPDLDTYQIFGVDAAGDPWYPNDERMSHWWKMSSAPLFGPKVSRLVACELEEPRSIVCQGYHSPKIDTDDMDDENLISTILLCAEEDESLPVNSLYSVLEDLAPATLRLSVWGQGEMTSDIVDRLSKLPNVDQIGLGHEQPMDLFMQRISLPPIGEPDSKEWGFPGLQSLIFVDIPVDQEKLLSMVETRWEKQSVGSIKMNEPKPLLAIEMRESSEKLQPDIRQKLDRILGEGVLEWPKV